MNAARAVGCTRWVGRLLLSRNPPPVTPPGQSDWVAAPSVAPLVYPVRRAVGAGSRRDAEPYLIDTALWANVHGLVSLELGGAMPDSTGPPGALFEAAIRANLDGWRARP